MLVMKFGGSSVKDAKMFQVVSGIVKTQLGRNPVVILSAVKGTTDSLLEGINEAIENKTLENYNSIIANHKKIISDLNIEADILSTEFDELKETFEVIIKSKDNSKKIIDYVSFFGERMSVKILSELLKKQGIESNSYISGDIGVNTNSQFGNATLQESAYVDLKQIKEINGVPVITGFGGKDDSGEFTTFCRGGSDYVASIIGTAIDAKEIQIWTDVNGILSADPRLVDSAKTISEVSFDEASELAYFGAKVLHPKTILPAIKKNIPIKVLNTFNPEHIGTTIITNSGEADELIKAITYKKGITIIDVISTRLLGSSGYLAKIFEVFEKYNKSVDMLSTSEVSVSMTVDNEENLDKIISELEEIANVDQHNNRAIVYVVGNYLKARPGMAGKIFGLIGKEGINIELISQCFDRVSLGLVVKEEDASKVVKLLHSNLIE